MTCSVSLFYPLLFCPIQEEIRQALDRLCSVLPKTLSGECQAFVDTYTEQIIHMLIDDLTPDQVCRELHLCDSKGKGLGVIFFFFDHLESVNFYC